MSSPSVITRFAPSPTGFLHLGNYRTALFSYLHAKQHGGSFILRIEDTDTERSKKEYEDDILTSLKWLGLPHDSLYRQSERTEIYKKHLKDIIEKGDAYLSKEESTEGKRGEVIRFKNPNKPITFKDLIRGEITTDTTDLGDFVIAKSMNEPLYHFAVVVDDFEMGVTHIVRGEDHISNTPRHILLQEALGAPRPEYAHLPLVLAPDRTKLSKRKGALSVKDCKEQGYLPEAIINMLALVGWNGGTEQELFTLEQLLKVFSLEKIQKGSAIFNIEKLNWLNREYLKELSHEEFFESVKEFIPESLQTLSGYSEEKFKKLIPTLRDRVEKLSDIKTMGESGELDYFFKAPDLDQKLIIGTLKQQESGKAPSVDVVKKHLEHLVGIVEKLPEEATHEEIHEKISAYAEAEGRGAVLWPLRYSLSGKERSPDPFTLAHLIGMSETISRLKTALTLLN